jgi:hypothetical protein
MLAPEFAPEIEGNRMANKVVKTVNGSGSNRKPLKIEGGSFKTHGGKIKYADYEVLQSKPTFLFTKHPALNPIKPKTSY